MYEKMEIKFEKVLRAECHVNYTGMKVDIIEQNVTLTLREKCPHSELFWSVFSRIPSKCRKIRTRITPNTDTFYSV